MYILGGYPHNLQMSNWQAAEEGDIQDDFEFELEGTVNYVIINLKYLFAVFFRIKLKRIQFYF